MKRRKKESRQRKLVRRLVGVAAVLWAVVMGLLIVEPEAAASRMAGITVSFHGEEFSADLREETVGALLNRLGLTPGAEDVLSLPPDTRVQEGMALSVDIRQARQEVFTLVLARETVYIPDDSILLGTEKELSPGADGQLRCTALVEYCNGVEVSRQILEREILTQAQDRVIAQGQQPETTDPVIRDGYIQLTDGTRLTYTKTAVLSASAYTHTDLFRSQTSALGTAVHPGTMAVNPSQIPYGTRVFLMAQDGSWVYGIARAEDNLIGSEGTDVALYFPTTGVCMDFGTRDCIAYFLG